MHGRMDISVFQNVAKGVIAVENSYSPAAYDGTQAYHKNVTWNCLQGRVEAVLRVWVFVEEEETL